MTAVSDKEERGPGAVFNIGNQQGVVTNVGGDQNIYGGQQNQVVIPAAEIATQIDALRRALDGLELPSGPRADAHRALDEAEAEVKQPAPNAPAVASKLTRFAEIVKDVGALAAAGLSLINPLAGVAALLGPLGHSIVEIIHDF